LNYNRFIASITVIVAILVTAGLYLSLSDRRYDSIEKVLVIGLDGADFRRMDPLLQNGELPNIQKLIGNGARGPMLSMIPSISPASWVAFTSGKNPGKSGVLHFLHPRLSNRYSVHDIDSRQCAVKRIWNILSDRYKKVITQGVPVTYPPEKINGVMISGWLAPKNSVFTYPAKLTEDYRKRGYVTFVEQVKIWGPNTPPNQFDKTMDEHLKIDEIRRDVAIELLDNREWDFFMVVFENIDHIQHVISQDIGPINTYYKKMDTIIGDLVAAAGNNTLVVIGSDHGFGRVHHFFNVRKWLQTNDILNYKTHKNLHYNGELVSTQPFKSVSEYDFEETGDNVQKKTNRIEYNGISNFGEDGIDFTVPGNSTVTFQLRVQSSDGTKENLPVRIGKTGYPADEEYLEISEADFNGNCNQQIYYGDKTAKTVKADMGFFDLTGNPPVVQIRNSGTRLCVFDYLSLIDSVGDEIFIDSEDIEYISGGEFAAIGESDGKWWRQRWEEFRGGFGLVAHPGENTPPLRIQLPVDSGQYQIYIGTYSGSIHEGESILVLEIPVTDSYSNNRFYCRGKPTYTPGSDSGYFIWLDDNGWHLRWSGAANQTTKQVDWSRTYAWDPFWSVSPYGSIFLNVKDREPHGIIMKSDYETARKSLADQLLKYKDPATGKQVVIKTFTREELYTGPYVDEMPDLLFEVDSDYCIYHRDVGSHHKRTGILIFSGPEIQKGVRFNSSILDVTPTLLYALGLPVADDMDGRVLTEIFTDRFLKINPLHSIETYCTNSYVRRENYGNDQISSDIQDRLRALGYTE